MVRCSVGERTKPQIVLVIFVFIVIASMVWYGIVCSWLSTLNHQLLTSSQSVVTKGTRKVPTSFLISEQLIFFVCENMASLGANELISPKNSSGMFQSIQPPFTQRSTGQHQRIVIETKQRTEWTKTQKQKNAFQVNSDSDVQKSKTEKKIMFDS